MGRFNLSFRFHFRFEPWRNLSHIGTARFRSTVCSVVRRCSRRGCLIKELFAPARVFFTTPLFVFGPELGFDLRPNACFEIDPLTLFSLLSRTLRFLSPQLRLGLGL